jgi:hypothetical protein
MGRGVFAGVEVSTLDDVFPPNRMLEGISAYRRAQRPNNGRVQLPLTKSQVPTPLYTGRALHPL